MEIVRIEYMSHSSVALLSLVFMVTFIAGSYFNNGKRENSDLSLT